MLEPALHSTMTIKLHSFITRQLRSRYRGQLWRLVLVGHLLLPYRSFRRPAAVAQGVCVRPSVSCGVLRGFSVHTLAEEKESHEDADETKGNADSDADSHIVVGVVG